MSPSLAVFASLFALAACAPLSPSAQRAAAPRTEERCAYRWQVEGDAVTLVAITPKGEEPHRITGLPGPCEAQGTVMSCAAFDVRVTSNGGNWVIWLSPADEGADDVPILIVFARVRRGCNL